MKRKNYALLLLLCLYFTASRAQIDNYKLSDYKLPKLKRQTLSTDLSFSGYTESENYKNEENDNESKTFNLRGDFRVGYSFYYNSDKYQGTHFVIGDYDPNYSVQKDSVGTTNETSGFVGNIYINSENRYYLYEKFFVGLFPNLRYHQEKQHTPIDEYNADEKENFKTTTFKLPVAVGYGRIEQVQDARLAIYILDELRNKGKLTRKPTAEEVNEFAQLISTVINERVLDYRKKKIYEIKEIDAFLRERGFIETTDVDYFTMVNDYWDYAKQPIRESGYRISLGFAPDIQLMDQNNEDLEKGEITPSKFHYDSKKTGIAPFLMVEWNKPINLKWQFEVQSKISYGKYDYAYTFKFDDGDDSKTSYDYKKFFAELRFDLGYYPNTRTYVKLYSALNYSNDMYYRDDRDELNTQKILYSGIDANYYISDRVTIYGKTYLNLYNSNGKGEYDFDAYDYSRERNYSNFIFGIKYNFM